jgi:gamma-glutamylcyclotransferase (GGCT)/AIG2-like uncharacterized protein YtfP
VTLYFAYGANMDPVQMAGRCPGARQLGVAMLVGHAFGIGKAGYGTALPSAGEVVHGVLWALERDDEASLDRFEGVGDGLYTKRRVRVLKPDGEVTEAMMYYAVDPTPGAPTPGYLERIVEVAESLGFPPDYIAALGSRLTP